MNGSFKQVSPVPCQHIADFYSAQWEAAANLHNKLLKIGYAQWAIGWIEVPINNLYGKANFRRNSHGGS